MDFALLPPEINSARIYTGPGSASLLAAAGSWDSLAAELATTAETYESVVWGLATLNWRGPASESMTATAAPYIGWLHTTAEETKQTAMQARAAAAAFEQAFAITVPPTAVAANRAQLTALIATNLFGQNTAAIATNEALYAEMWAQDAAAMFGYASSSAAATALAPFTQPQQATNPDGAAGQSAAVSKAIAALSGPLQQLRDFVANVPEDFEGLVGQGPDSGLYDVFGPDAPMWGSLSSTGVFTLPATIDIATMAGDAVQGEAAAGSGAGGASGLTDAVMNTFAALFAGPAAVPPHVASAISSGSGAVSAVLTGAKTIGPMSVPASWSAPVASHVAPLSGAGLTTLPGTEEAVGSGMPGIPGMPAGTLTRASGVLPRYGVRLTVMPRPPAAG
jgi:PPE-repeat protein